MRARSPVRRWFEVLQSVGEGRARASVQPPLMRSRACVLVVVVRDGRGCRWRRGRRRRRGAGWEVAADAGLDGTPRAWSHARPAERRLEFAADGEHRVADLLGIEPTARPLPEQSVLGIDPPGVGKISRSRSRRRLSVGRRGQDHPMNRLPVASPGPTNSRRQPVEQFGMAGGLAQPAEIAGSANQAASEVILPDPVDDHPGRERVVGPAEPAGQRQPAAG